MSMTTRPALVIRPAQRTIEPVQIINPSKSLADLYTLIGTNIVQLVPLVRNADLWVDEEGLLKPTQRADHWFAFGTHLVGIGVYVPRGAKALTQAQLYDHLGWQSPEERALRASTRVGTA